MGNRCTPGCCCGKCEIFQCDFDLYYKLPTIPTDVSDWNWEDTRTSEMRKFEILPGNPGEGLVFRQGTGSLPVFPSGKQARVPTFTEHPDIAAIQSLPNFGVLGTGAYWYRISAETDSVVPGYYRLDSVLSGPFPTSVAPIEPRWDNYWRNHFEVWNSGGIVEIPVDRFPFHLNAGEFVLSKRKLPNKWFAVSFNRALHWDWTLDVEATVAMRLVDDSQDTLVGIRRELLDLSGTRRIKSYVERSGATLPIDVLPFNLYNVSTPNPFGFNAGYWFIVRDDHIDYSLAIDGIEDDPPYGDVLALRSGMFSSSTGDDFSYGAINTKLTEDGSAFPRSKIMLRASKDNCKLGSISAHQIAAPRLTTWPTTEGDGRGNVININPDCTPRPTCPVIYPYQHLKWRLKQLTLDGLDVPTVADTGVYECLRDFRLAATPYEVPPAYIEIPAYEHGAGVIYFDYDRIPRNFSWPVTTYAPAIVGGMGLSTIGGRVSVYVSEGAAGFARLRVWLAFIYLTTTYDVVSGIFSNTGMLEHHGIVFPGFIGPDAYVPDGSLPPFYDVTGTPYGSRGWLHYDGTGNLPGVLVGQTAYMFWDREIQKWEGDDFPTITLDGTGYDFSAPVPPSLTSSPVTQPQTIRLVTSFGVTAGTPSGPTFGTYTVSGTTVDLDLASIVLRIGPES